MSGHTRPETIVKEGVKLMFIQARDGKVLPVQEEEGVDAALRAMDAHAVHAFARRSAEGNVSNGRLPKFGKPNISSMVKRPKRLR